MNNFLCNRCNCCPCCCCITGPTGATGPTGVTGPIAATVPFSISTDASGQGALLSTDDQGNPSDVYFAGFGVADQQISLSVEGGWNGNTITIGQEVFYPISFIMPYEGTLQKIHVLFATRDLIFLEEGVTARPFVCLTVSDGSSLVFTILPDTITFTEPYVGGEDIPKYSLRSGSTDLNIEITEGTLVGIVIGWFIEGTAEALNQQGRFSVSGSLFLE